MSAGAAAASMFAPSGKAGENAKAISMLLIVIAIIILGYVIVNKMFGGWNSFFEALGLKESAEDKARREKLEGQLSGTNNPSSPWSPQFYKSAPAGTKLVTAAKADEVTKQIWDSVGSIWDDPESGLAAIKQLPSQAAVSFIADRFNNRYQRDLLGWLNIKYDTDSQKDVLIRIINYVDQLPKYK